MSLYKGNQLIAGCVPDMVNQSLSNLNSAGTKVIDGQWVNLERKTIFTSVSLNGSTVLSYTLTDVPDDGHEYEVLLTFVGTSSSTSGQNCILYVYSDKTSGNGGTCIFRATPRSAASVLAGGNVTLPLSNSRKIYIIRATNYYGTIDCYLHTYRRIGTNT